MGSRISRERRKPARAAEASRRRTAMREGLGLVLGGNEVEVLVTAREWGCLVAVSGRRSRRAEGEEEEEAIMAPNSNQILYFRLDKPLPVIGALTALPERTVPNGPPWKVRNLGLQ